MAALVLGLAGSAIGGSTMVTGALGISAAMGASLGWSLGSMLGGMLGPKQKIEGPRLQDGKVQASTHGQVIPIIYGSYRTAGNIIDFSGMREHAKKERSKKAKTVMTTYSYECDVAVGICAGTIGGVRRIWANNELIYSVAEDADLATIQASNNAAGNIKIYTGSETQLPDPTLEALHGAGNVPAYRGLAYIVISRIWVEKYGNRLPNFEFEVVGSGVGEGSQHPFLDGNRTSANSIVSQDGSTYSYAIQGSRIVVRKLSPLQDMFERAFQLPTIDNLPEGIEIPAGHIMPYMSYAVLSVTSIISMVSVQVVSLSPSGDSYNQGFFYFLHPVFGLSAPILRSPDSLFTITANAAIVFVRPDTDISEWSISTQYYRFNVNADGFTVELEKEDARYLYQIGLGRYYDESENIIYVYHHQNEIIIYDALDIYTYYTVDLSSLPARFSGRVFSIVGASGNLITGLVLAKKSASVYDLEKVVLRLDDDTQSMVVGFTTEVLIPNYDPAPYGDGWFSNYGGAYVMQSSSLYSIAYIAYVAPSIKRTSATLRGVLLDVCARVGVSPDVSGIPPDLSVGGYCISRQISARGAIEPLQNAYFFDAVESDNGLKFIMRGGDQVATIIEDDMMAGIDQPADGDPATVVRGQEVELPQSVSVSYADWDSDYQTSSEMVQRQVTPSVNKISTELPIAMSADQAARIADVWMYQAWSERTQLSFKVGAKHMRLEPTDVITVQTAGQTFKARITGKTDDRGVIDVAAVVDSGRYTSNATGSSNLGSQTNIAIQSPSLMFLLDSPIITDAEDDAGMYASLIPEAVLSNSVTWGGATLMMNEGGNSDVIHTVSSVGNPATCIGAVQAAVAKPVGRANIIDQSYTITVKTNGRPMDSISREQLFNHNNLFAVVNSQAGVVQELLQFQTATETAEDTYKLSGILRGRFGTDSQVDVIAAGAYLVQLNPRNAILRVPGMPAQIGQEFAYKAVTNGSTVENAQTVRYANTARGLKPYAPVRLNGRRVGNDWHLRWTRRSRIDGGWRNSVDVPLGEASEEYNLTIPSKRVAVVSTPAFIYTEAMQIADFGSAQSSLTFTVAQVSVAVGAGVLASWSSS